MRKMASIFNRLAEHGVRVSGEALEVWREFNERIERINQRLRTYYK